MRWNNGWVEALTAYSRRAIRNWRAGVKIKRRAEVKDEGQDVDQDLEMQDSRALQDTSILSQVSMPPKKRKRRTKPTTTEPATITNKTCTPTSGHSAIEAVELVAKLPRQAPGVESKEATPAARCRKTSGGSRSSIE